VSRNVKIVMPGTGSTVNGIAVITMFVVMAVVAIKPVVMIQRVMTGLQNIVVITGMALPAMMDMSVVTVVVALKLANIVVMT